MASVFLLASSFNQNRVPTPKQTGPNGVELNPGVRGRFLYSVTARELREETDSPEAFQKH